MSIYTLRYDPEGSLLFSCYSSTKTISFQIKVSILHYNKEEEEEQINHLLVLTSYGLATKGFI